MAPHSTNDEDIVLDRERDWAVYRCSHGCLHVAIDRLTLTLSESEFEALRELFQRAGRLLREPAGYPALAARAH